MQSFAYAYLTTLPAVQRKKFGCNDGSTDTFLEIVQFSFWSKYYEVTFNLK